MLTSPISCFRDAIFSSKSEISACCEVNPVCFTSSIEFKRFSNLSSTASILSFKEELTPLITASVIPEIFIIIFSIDESITDIVSEKLSSADILEALIISLIEASSSLTLNISVRETSSLASVSEERTSTL